MLIGRIAGTTMVIGQSQGYNGLPLRRAFVWDNATNQPTAVLESAWEPTPKELDALNAGKSLILRMHGITHPPVYLGVDADVLQAEHMTIEQVEEFLRNARS